MNDAKILFIGGTKRGYLLLEELVTRRENIIGVYGLKEDEHENLKYHQRLEELCQVNHIRVRMTRKISEEYAREIRDLFCPDLIICVGWRTMIPNEVLKCPRYGCVGVHDSLLPEYRGFAPLNWCILNGENKTGVTLLHLSEGVDEGDIIDQREIAIHPHIGAPDLYEQVIKHSTKIVLDNLDLLKIGKGPRKQQAHHEATYTCSRTPEDGLINWLKSTADIYNLIRGLAYPYPGAFTFYNKKKMFIRKARPLDNPKVYIGRIPGRVVKIEPESVDVLTGDGVLSIKEVQFEDHEAEHATFVIKSIKAKLG